MAASLGPEQGFLFPGTPVQNSISSYVYHLMPVNFVPILQQVDIFRRSGIPGSLLELNPQQYVIVPHQPAQNVFVPERPGSVQGLQRFNSTMPEQNVPFAERVAERYRVDNNQDYARGGRPDLPRVSPAEQAEYLDPLGESEVWQSAYSTVITTARQINQGPSQINQGPSQINQGPSLNFPMESERLHGDSGSESVETGSENLESDSVSAATESSIAGALGEALSEENGRGFVDRLIRRMDSFDEDEDSVYRRPHITVLAQQLSESVTHLLPDSLQELHDRIGIGRVMRGRSVTEEENVASSPALHIGAKEMENSRDHEFENVLHELQNLNTLEVDGNVGQLHHSETENQSLCEDLTNLIHGNPQGITGSGRVSLQGQVSDVINVNRPTETVSDITGGKQTSDAGNDNIHRNIDGSARINICSSNRSEGHSTGLNNSITHNAVNSVTHNAVNSVTSDMTQLDIRALRNQLQYDWTMNLGLPDAAETYNALAGEMTGTILHELLRNLSTRGNRVGSDTRQSSLRQYYNNLVYQFYYETFLWLYLAVTTDPRSIHTWALIQVISQIAGQSAEDVTVTMLAGFLESGISQSMEYTDVLEESFARVERNRAVGPEDEMIMRELAMRMNIQLDPRRMLRRFGDVIRQAARVLLIDASSSFPPIPQR